MKTDSPETQCWQQLWRIPWMENTSIAPSLAVLQPRAQQWHCWHSAQGDGATALLALWSALRSPSPALMCVELMGCSLHEGIQNKLPSDFCILPVEK